MKKQKIISQTKGQDKIPEKQLNEVGIGNLPEKEFRITIVKMIQDLRKSMEKMQDAYQRPRRTKEKTEMNNTLERINSRITEAELINDREDRLVEITTTEQNIGKKCEKERQPDRPLGQH